MKEIERGTSSDTHEAEDGDRVKFKVPAPKVVKNDPGFIRVHVEPDGTLQLMGSHPFAIDPLSSNVVALRLVLR